MTQLDPNLEAKITAKAHEIAGKILEASIDAIPQYKDRVTVSTHVLVATIKDVLRQAITDTKESLDDLLELLAAEQEAVEKLKRKIGGN